MNCKILLNYFEDEGNFEFTDFELDLKAINGFGEKDNLLFIMINGTLYCFLYEEQLHKELQSEMAKRKMYNLN